MHLSRAFLLAIVLMAVIFSGTGCWIDGMGWPRARFERTVELRHPMAPGLTLAASTTSGSIGVSGRAVEEAVVVATIEGRADDEEEAVRIAEQTVVRFEPRDDGLVVRADKPELRRRQSVSISYEILVPRQTSVECGSTSGSVEVAGLEGDVRAKAVSGAVGASGIEGGDINLDSTSGQVRLSNAAQIGYCRMHTSSGRILASMVEISTSLEIGSTSGPIDVSDAMAEGIALRSVSGSVTARDIQCAHVNAESGSGCVAIYFAAKTGVAGGLYADLDSTSGSVHLLLPPDFAGQVDLSSTSGAVRTDRPLEIKGQIDRRHIVGAMGQGPGRVTARSRSGSVRVR